MQLYAADDSLEYHLPPGQTGWIQVSVAQLPLQDSACRRVSSLGMGRVTLISDGAEDNAPAWRNADRLDFHLALRLPTRARIRMGDTGREFDYDIDRAMAECDTLRRLADGHFCHPLAPQALPPFVWLRARRVDARPTNSRKKLIEQPA